MKKSTLVLRSLSHYWRTHLAVLLGVIAGTAVISGALIVGDSVRGSLKQMSLDRLGGIDLALRTHRFVREDLATELIQSPEFASRFEAVAPALMMDGGLVRQDATGTVSERVGGVHVFAVDARFSEFGELTKDALPEGDQLVLCHRVAAQINAKVGDELTLWLELPATIPRDSLLGGSMERTTQEVALKVSRVLPETSGTGRLDLNPSQQLPLTAFVSLQRMQLELGLEQVRRSKEFPQGKPARINAMFVKAKAEADRTTAQATDAAKAAMQTLSQRLTLADLSLRVVPHETRRYLTLEGEQMILDDKIVAAARDSARELNWPTSSVMMYLANEMLGPTAAQKDDPIDGYSMYSTIAGIELSEFATSPFGPLSLKSTPLTELGDDEAVLNEWLANDLEIKVGESVTVTYHVVGSHGELPEEKLVLKVRDILPLDEKTAATDRGLVPLVRGITDAKTYNDWKQPFPMKLNRLTGRDEGYWEEHRALPKIFVSLKTAQRLWQSRYGKLTSFRVAPAADADLAQSVQQFEAALLKHVDAEQVGLAFLPVKWQGLQAASGTTDFTGLFIGFSFFVIASAMVLIGLLFRLSVERRVSQIGLLIAVGFENRQVRRLILLEGLSVAVVGGVVGSVAAVGYKDLMVFALKSPDWWGGALGTQFLTVHVTPLSLIAGFVISVLVATSALLLALRGLKQITPRQLLAGTSEPALSADAIALGGRKQRKIARACFAISIPIVALGLFGLIPSSEAFSGLSWLIVAFFTVGMLLFVGSLQQLSASLIGQSRWMVRGAGLLAVCRLGFRNAARNRDRSVLSTALIASATFVIVAVAAGRRDPSVESPELNSGNGGFVLVAESATSVLPDLNNAAGREKAGILTTDKPELAKLLEDSEVFSFRVRPGENASCLNLYQTHLPTILGVPESLLKRGGFKFIDQRKADYWKLLADPRDDGLIPVVGDMNTLMFSLHQGPGSTIAVPQSESKLAVVGMLDSSVFQGVLLMSEANFQKLFPEQVGYRYFLIGAKSERRDRGGFSAAEVASLSSVLEGGLTPYGFDAERVADRIAAFLIVQNTYLSTFQTLGGLGLLLGTLGLATVMLRNVVERRSELALLAAVGFRPGSIRLMVLAENALLLVFGLAVGTGCALLAMLPHLLNVGADTPWLSGAKLLLLVFIAGMTAASFAVREAARTPIVSTLRGG